MKETKNHAIIMIVLGLLFSQFSLFAENSDSLKTYNVDEVVISAIRMVKPISEIGRSVSLITRAQLSNSIYTSPSELLQNYEGINIIGSRQNPGALQNLYMRGANTNQTVIMIDGLRITDPSSAENAIDLSELSLASVQRIEIVRGSHSTLFGSSAIGGVVNFITDKNMDAGINFDANFKSGIFGHKGSDISQNMMLNYTAHNGFYINGEVYNTRVKGIDATVKSPLAVVPYMGYDKDNFRKTDMTGKIGFNNARTDVYFTYKNTNQKADIDAGAFKDDDNTTIDFKRNLYSYGASYKFNDEIKFSYIGGYTDLAKTNVNDSSVIDAAGHTDQTYFRADYSGTVFNNEIQANISLENVNFVLGAGLYKETMNNKSFYYSGSPYGAYISQQDLSPLDINANTKNLFVYCDVNGAVVNTVLERFSLALGARYNNHSSFGSKTTYEVNPSYKVTDNSLLYFSYATGFNAPALYRLYTLNEDATVQIQRGNKYLKAEESRSIEVGYKQAVGSVLNFTAAYYNTEVNNSIDYVYLWDKNIPTTDLGTDWTRNDYLGDTYLNIGKLLTYGVELTMTAKITDELTASVNYSQVNGRLNYSAADIDQRQTLGNQVQIFSNGAFLNKDVEQDNLVRRVNTGNFSLNYKPLEELSMKLDVHYVGKKDDVVFMATLGPWGAMGVAPVPNYTLFDFSVKYNFLNSLTAIVKINNMLDKNYQEVRGYTTLGRAAYLSLRYSLHY